VKRDLKDWSITKELALDRREWKLAIHLSEPITLRFPSSFSPLFCLGFSAHVVLSLAYPNLLETKMLDCCCFLH
jgi:hypothetical protein